MYHTCLAPILAEFRIIPYSQHSPTCSASCRSGQIHALNSVSLRLISAHPLPCSYLNLSQCDNAVHEATYALSTERADVPISTKTVVTKKPDRETFYRKFFTCLQKADTSGFQFHKTANLRPHKVQQESHVCMLACLFQLLLQQLRRCMLQSISAHAIL